MSDQIQTYRIDISEDGKTATAVNTADESIIGTFTVPDGKTFDDYAVDPAEHGGAHYYDPNDEIDFTPAEPGDGSGSGSSSESESENTEGQGTGDEGEGTGDEGEDGQEQNGPGEGQGQDSGTITEEHQNAKDRYQDALEEYQSALEDLEQAIQDAEEKQQQAEDKADEIDRHNGDIEDKADEAEEKQQNAEEKQEEIDDKQDKVDTGKDSKGNMDNAKDKVNTSKNNAQNLKGDLKNDYKGNNRGKSNESKQVKDPKERSEKDGEPVNLYSGSFYTERVDISIPAMGFDLSIKRYYNNQIYHKGSFGIKWSIWFDSHIRELSDGSLYFWRMESHGMFILLDDEDHYCIPEGYFETVRKLPSGFEVEDRYGETAYYNTQGYLIKRTDRFGNRIDITRNANQTVDSISSPCGKSLNFQYNGDELISSITDHTGRTYSYNYQNDNLVSVILPPTSFNSSGRRIHYEYDSNSDPRLDNALVRIKDHNNNNIVQNTYGLSGSTFNRITSQHFIGDQYLFLYDEVNIDLEQEEANRHEVARKTSVINGRGIRTESSFNPFGNVLEQKTITNGIRPGDPADWSTKFRYDSLGNVKEVEYPNGFKEQYLYDIYNSDALMRGNLLKVTANPAGTGANLYTHYEYGTYNQVTKLTAPDSTETIFTLSVDGVVTRIEFPATELPDGSIQQSVGQYTYNSRGQVTVYINPEDVQFTYTYFESGLKKGLLKEVSVDGVMQSRFDYDDLGRALKYSNALSAEFDFEHNENDELLLERAPTSLGYEKKYSYTEEGFIDKEEIKNIDSDGVTVGTSWIARTFDYDLRGRITKVTEPLNSSEVEETYYEYDSENNITKITYANGNEIVQTYDERNLLYQVLEMPGTPLESVDTFTYDGLGNLVTYKNPLNRIFTNEFDGFGRHLKAIDPYGNFIKAYWSSNGYITKLERRNSANILLSKTEYSVDELGRSYKIKDSIVKHGSVTGTLEYTTLFDRLGRPVQITDPSSHDFINEFDSLNAIVKTTDPIGNKTHFSRNALGLPVEVKHELINTAMPSVKAIFRQQIEYDEIGRLKAVNDALGNRIAYQYDSRDLIGKIIRPDGITETFEHDLGGRLTKVSVPYIDESGTNLGVVERIQTYDLVSNLKTVTDANGNSSTFHYDLKENLLSLELPNGERLYNNVYDAAGSVIQQTDPNGNVTTYSYDLLSRITRKDFALSPNTEGVTFEQYSYDELHQLVSQSNDHHTNTRVYDSLGRMHEDSIDGRRTEFKFYSNSLLKKIIYPSALEIELGWDQNGRIKTMTLAKLGNSFDGNSNVGSLLAEFDYIGQNLVGKITYGNGLSETFTYDASSRVSSILLEDSSNTLMQSVHYIYDAMGRINYVDRSGISGTSMLYDSVGQLVKIIENDSSATGLDLSAWEPSSDSNNPLPSEQQPTLSTLGLSFADDLTARRIDYYEFDNNGNRKKVTKSTNGTTSTNNYVVNELNQYASIDGTPLSYDKNGNVIDDGNYLYSYDYRNRLIAIADKASGTEMYRFSYDNSHRLVSYTESGITKTLSYGGPEVLEEIADSKTDIHVVGGSIDQNLIKFEGGSSRFRHLNNVQHVLTITDESGQIDVHVAIDEFGNVLKAYDQALNEIPLPDYCKNYFQGRKAIGDTDLFYFRTRFYSAKLGRFMQTDEYGYGADMNLYRFVMNNPTLFVDPSGKLHPIVIGIGVGIVVGGLVAAALNWDKSGTDFWVAVGAGMAGGAVMGTGYGLASMAAGGAVSGLISGSYDGYKTGGMEGALAGGGFGAAFGGLGGFVGGYAGSKVSTSVAGRVYSKMLEKGFKDTVAGKVYNKVISDKVRAAAANQIAGYTGVAAGGIVDGGLSGGISGFGNGVGQGLASGQSVTDSLKMGAANVAPGMFYGGLLGGASAVGAKGMQQGVWYAKTKTKGGVFGKEGEWNVRNQTWQQMNETVTTPKAHAKGGDKIPDLWGEVKGDVKNTAKIPSPNAQKGQFRSFYREIVGNLNEKFTIYHRPGVKIPGPRSAVGKWVDAGDAVLIPIKQWTWSPPVGRDWNCNEEN